MTDEDTELLAELAYTTWAANKAVPPWVMLPDFRRHTWRQVARELWTVMERIAERRAA